MGVEIVLWGSYAWLALFNVYDDLEWVLFDVEWQFIENALFMIWIVVSNKLIVIVSERNKVL